MNINIRSATLDDAAMICTVVRRSIAETCIEDHHNDAALIETWLRNKTISNVEAWMQSPNAYSVVAEVDHSVVGFGMSRADEILLCYVVPEVRFKGVGKSVLQALETYAATNGISHLRLESTRTAEPFYRRNGFNAAGPAVLAFGMEGQPMTKAVTANHPSL